ncbi:hypothetical protein TcWFU_005496 [Taenia crassiceps]|uniref:Uncharacterized protein n=1 Tax=Taenia crassiceps TaxID=6207 RepID=A0ABR4QR79_9CEST
MGNVSVSAGGAHQSRKFSSPLATQKLKLLDIDPRSPTDGIVPFTSRLPFDASDFESIDGCITEDDSVHNARNTSALSDNAISTNGVNDRVHKKGTVLARVRRSLMPRRFRDSPSLMVQMRQKEMIERSKQQCEQEREYQTRQEGEAVSTSMEMEIVGPNVANSVGN